MISVGQGNLETAPIALGCTTLIPLDRVLPFQVPLEKRQKCLDAGGDVHSSYSYFRARPGERHLIALNQRFAQAGVAGFAVVRICRQKRSWARSTGAVTRVKLR